jgi:hypothetical protein
MIKACQGGVVETEMWKPAIKKPMIFSRLVAYPVISMFISILTGRTGLKMEMDNNLFEVVRITEDERHSELRLHVTYCKLERKICLSILTTLKSLSLMELSGVNSESLIRTRDLTISSPGLPS